jgi:hypothetical protein
MTDLSSALSGRLIYGRDVMDNGPTCLASPLMEAVRQRHAESSTGSARDNGFRQSSSRVLPVRRGLVARLLHHGAPQPVRWT